MRHLILILVCSMLSLAPTSVTAQDSVPGQTGRAMASRAELERQVAAATDAEARAAIQSRLTEGDLKPGDLVALSVIEESTLTDTFTVRAGQTLLLPNIPEFSVKGVLRSELQSFMAQKIAQYVRNPQVDAVALVRVAVLGSVGAPGFYTVPAQMPASQVVMVAGGPGAQGDVNKVELRRGELVVLEEEQMASAFAAGTSVDQLGVQGGDQFFVGNRPGGLRGALQTVGLITGVFTGIYFATRIF